MTVLLGCAKIDITPERPIPLSGFAVRGNKPYETVHTRLYARAVVLQQADPVRKDGVNRALVVSADLLWWGTDRMDTIRETMASRWGLKPECVILNATHSHSGPQTSFRFHRLLGTADTDYVEQLEQKLYSAVEEAFHNLEPVQVERGVGECQNGVQRRRYVDGITIGGPNPDGPIDHEVNVVRFQALSGHSKAIMVHYACHPVTTNANEISSEFTGHAMERLEREINGAVCLFLQGCCADINVYTESADTSLTDPREIVAYFGDRLADSVLATLERPMKSLPEARLSGIRIDVPLQLRPLASRETLNTLAAQGKSPYDEWAQVMLERFNERDTALTMEFTRLDVAEGLSLLAMNAEVVVEYGLYVKALSDNIMPMGYSNGMIGYVPMAYQLRSNGYEADSSTYYFHMPARLEPEIETPVMLTLKILAERETARLEEAQ